MATRYTTIYAHQRREASDVKAGTTTTTRQSASGKTTYTSSFAHVHKKIVEQTVVVTETIRQATASAESSANGLTHQLKGFTDEALKAIRSTRSKVNGAKVDCGWYGTTLLRDLTKAAYKSYEYVDNVDDLYYYGCDRNRVWRVKAGILQGDFKELEDFLDQLQRTIVRCESSYRIAMESFREVERSSDRAANYCDEQGRKERNKKNATKAVGGAAATGALAAGVAGGVTASVIAGVFTFGIGTLVGLGLTAAGSVAAGSGIAAATGVATYCIASDFEESERAFRDLSRSFADVRSSASRVLEHAYSIRTHLESISASLDDAEHAKSSQAVRTSLTAALDRLCEKFGEAYAQSSVCRDTLKQVKENM